MIHHLLLINWNLLCSLIVAAPDLDTWSLVKDLLPLLSNSAPFAIYHQFLQVISFRLLIKAKFSKSFLNSSLEVTPKCYCIDNSIMFEMQPLATCMHNLQLGKMAIGLQISEPWLREYQVCIYSVIIFLMHLCSLSTFWIKTVRRNMAYLIFWYSFFLPPKLIQVLPSRTHPCMQMSAFGGYILSGTKICSI